LSTIDLNEKMMAVNEQVVANLKLLPKHSHGGTKENDEACLLPYLMNLFKLRPTG
jgi:hypothetical protein